MLLITGGAGFIGSNFVLDWLAGQEEALVNLDALTYAGNLENLESLEGDARHVFVQGNICDRALVDALLARHRPRAIVHFAAESHVDRSIHVPGAFMRTNVDGTFTLLEAARAYWLGLAEKAQGFSALGYHALSMALRGIMRMVNMAGLALSAGITVLDRMVEAIHQGALLSKKIAETTLRFVKAALRMCGRLALRAAVTAADLTVEFLQTVFDMMLAPVRRSALLALSAA